jgi:hypothetical protein
MLIIFNFKSFSGEIMPYSKKDKQHNSQKKKDKQHNSQKKKDKQQ